VKGRKPIPPGIKRLMGNPGKRPIIDNTPPPWSEKPKPPRHLGSVAKKEWKRMLAEFERLGIAPSCDATALALYCQVYERWVDAETNLKEQPLVLQGPQQPYQNPYLSIANKAFEQLKSLLVEFGMTPTSRCRITTSVEVKDEFADFTNTRDTRKTG